MIEEVLSEVAGTIGMEFPDGFRNNSFQFGLWPTAPETASGLAASARLDEPSWADLNAEFLEEADPRRDEVARLLTGLARRVPPDR